MFVGVALCGHMVGVMWLLSAVALVVERRGMSSEFPTSVWSFLNLALFGLGFLRGLTSKTSRSSLPLSLEVSSWRVLSFSEHLTSLAPSTGYRTPSARALHVLLRPGSRSSGRWRSCPCSWSPSFSWACQVAESLNKALCVLSSCHPCQRRRQLGRVDPSLQVLRTTWSWELPWSIPIRSLHSSKVLLVFADCSVCSAWVFRNFLVVVSESWLTWDHRWSLALNKLSFVASCALVRGKRGPTWFRHQLGKTFLIPFGLLVLDNLCKRWPRARLESAISWFRYLEHRRLLFT